MLLYFILAYALITILGVLFILAGSSGKWEKDNAMTFECGFTPSFSSRFSFSMHFFTVGVVFLFLDLELCFVMPFFNESFSSMKLIFLSWIFIMILLMGLLFKWFTKDLDWKF